MDSFLKNSHNKSAGMSHENGASGCIPGLAPCLNTDEYYFWDGFHLIEAVYSVIAARCVSGTGVCIPMNIQEL
ncbi:hypothetical protein RJ639_010562, partial [Escallonia herrerae]